MRWLKCLILASSLLSGASATAQERGQTGLTMGYPAAVGVLWHLTDRLAIRPEVSLSLSSTDYSDPLRVANDWWTVGVALSALLNVHRWDNLSAYVSPRYAYSKGKTTFKTDGAGTATSNTSSTRSIAGMFGAQYALGRRFGAFGEMGLEFSDATSDSKLTQLRSTRHSWGTRTGAGVVFYF